MSNAVFPEFKDAVFTAQASVSLNVNTAPDGPYVSLIDTGLYTYNVAHDFQNDTTAGVVGTDQRITTPTFGTVAAGTFDGDDVTFPSVTGNSVEALVIYRHNAGANTTWWLVIYIDTGVTNLPVTPNGGNIGLAWNASGICAF